MLAYFALELDMIHPAVDCSSYKGLSINLLIAGVYEYAYRGWSVDTATNKSSRGEICQYVWIIKLETNSDCAPVDI